MSERTKEICRALGGCVIGWVVAKLIDNHIQHKRLMSDLRNNIAYEREYGRLKD